MDLVRRCIAGALVGLTLGGCGAVGTKIATSDVEANLPQRTSQIVIGQSSRPDVRGVLGQPWLSSNYWRFDLYRIRGYDAAIGLAWIVVPVPVANLDTTTAYVLVTYDASGRVNDRSYGLAYDDRVIGTSAMASVRVDAATKAGFAYEDVRQRGWVYVGAELRDAYLKYDRSRTSCILLVGCTEDWCQTQFVIDEGSPVPLPDTVEGARKGIVPVSVTPGSHRIELRGMSFLSQKTDAHATFSCAAGDVRYGLIEVIRETYRESQYTRHRIRGIVTVEEETPLRWSEEPLMIWREGQWLLPPEPAS